MCKCNNLFSYIKRLVCPFKIFFKTLSNDEAHRSSRAIQGIPFREACSATNLITCLLLHYMTVVQLKRELKKLGDSEKAKILQGFFKTGKGQYGEGDVFLGVSVPQTRIVVKKHHELTLEETEELLKSKIHEERLAAILLLVYHFENAVKEKNEKKQKEIFDFYLSKASKVNNWDLVDLSAPKISGPYLLSRNRKILYKLANSKNLWEKRIAIISTFAFIRNSEFNDTFEITKTLLRDEHDLMHKACGWMLREVGKRDQPALEEFLKKHYKKMPRTMLRYAIEKFDEKKRKNYLNSFVK